MNLNILKLKELCDAHMIIIRDCSEWDCHIYDGKLCGSIQILIFSTHEGKEFKIGTRLSKRLVEDLKIPLMDYIFNMFEREKRKLIENDN